MPVDRYVAGLLAGLVLATGWAGCLGDDAAPAAKAPKEAEEAVATAKTGSITGQAVTNDLEVLAGVEIGLSGPTGLVATSTTDKQGEFTFNDLEPARYRLQVAAACCRTYSKDVSVVAGEVTQSALQLTRLTQDDLRVPYVVEEQWNGFIACGVGAAGAAVAVCSILDDPNDDFLETYTVNRGLTELVVAMTWDAVGGASGEEFNLLVERCDGGCFRYTDITGVSPLQTSIMDETTSREKHQFAQIEDEWEIRLRIFSGTGLTYQQPFTVHWYEFYYHNMPEGFQTIPDA